MLAQLHRADAARGASCGVGLGTTAFSMQDILLEPYGGEILRPERRRDQRADRADGRRRAGWPSRWPRACSAAAPTPTAWPPSARWSGCRPSAAVIFAAPLESPLLFRVGAALIGFGGGLFAVGTLTAAMSLERAEHVGLALGAWGAVQATAAGAVGGRRRRAARHRRPAWPRRALLGEALASPVTGYSFVYHLEMLPAVRHPGGHRPAGARRHAAAPRGPAAKFGLAEFPG